MKRLTLLGGGHSHVEVIRRFAMSPPRATYVLLVSPERYTVYSGMLPGFVAGHYDFRDCHIDLEGLCRAAHVEFRRARALDVDLVTRRVQCSDGMSVDYDVLSIDIGAAPETASISGALEHALPVKPLSEFVRAWQVIHDSARRRKSPLSFAVVGAGAGGVELALALQHRLCADYGGGAPRPVFHLLSDTATILPDHSWRVQEKFKRILLERNVAVHVESAVTQIDAGILRRQHGAPLAIDRAVLATTSSAPRWLAASGLRTDARGFVLVNEALQSLSHPEVFAAGDVASMRGYALPKSGVYAVRQGPPLATNLRHALVDEPLVIYSAQKTALALISTGDRYAVAAWRGIALEGKWVWRWKDRIDRSFVAKYRMEDAREGRNMTGE
jgi:selenide,water dikinase